MMASPPNIFVFVYGTLRKTGRYHHLLKNADYIATTQTSPLFTLVNVGTFPGLIKSGTTAVTGEVYTVTQEMLMALDVLEDVPKLYAREQITCINGITAWTYLLQPSHHKNLSTIASGDYFLSHET